MLHASPAHAPDELIPGEPTAEAQLRCARARTERQMAVLDRLVDVGMEIAEEAGRQAKAPAQERTLSDPCLTYSRAARAVRLTIALQQRLAEHLEQQGRDEAAARRTRAGRLVDRVIEADVGENPRLSGRAWRRLTEYEALDEMAGRSVEEIVARICEDLGLSPEACAEVMESIDLPPLGQAPDSVGGRGLQGGDVRDSALQPPSSAKVRVLSAGGEDRGPLDLEPAEPDG